LLTWQVVGMLPAVGVCLFSSPYLGEETCSEEAQLKQTASEGH
jgi:hypothetical protein